MATCIHHRLSEAVTQCVKCGRYICHDCFNTYGVSSGDYKGYALCYSCTCLLVGENIQYFEDLCRRTKNSRTAMIILGILGAISGLAIGYGVGYGDPGTIIAGFIFGIALGASIGTILSDIWLSIKVAFGMAKNDGGLKSDRGISSFGWGLLFGLIRAVAMIAVSPIIAIYQYVKRTRQIKDANKIMESDSQALLEMKDYFEYTLAVERSKGASLASLTKHGGELYNNTYANAVLSKGEVVAQRELRQSVIQIAKNGEILRSITGRR